MKYIYYIGTTIHHIPYTIFRFRKKITIDEGVYDGGW